MAKTVERTARARKKNGSGAFFATLLILIIAAGAVFWFGWVQFKLGENEVGVIYTKTGGYETKVLKNGEFAWRWQALLPTNLTLHVIKLETRQAKISAGGTLPSGDLYSKVVGNGISFEWSLSADIDYRLNPDSLPELMSKGLTGSDISGVYSEFESRLRSELGRIMAENANPGNPTSEKDILTAMSDNLSSGAASIDTNFQVINVNITELIYPDPNLYNQARALTLELMNSRKAVLTDVEALAIRREDIQNARIDLLRRYGEVFNKYPVLLDLFALEGNPGRSLLPPDVVE